jgi:hypothetical protein
MDPYLVAYLFVDLFGVGRHPSWKVERLQLCNYAMRRDYPITVNVTVSFIYGPTVVAQQRPVTSHQSPKSDERSQHLDIDI